MYNEHVCWEYILHFPKPLAATLHTAKKEHPSWLSTPGKFDAISSSSLLSALFLGIPAWPWY